VNEANIRDYGLKPYTRTSHSLPCVEEKPWILTCKLPYNCHFQHWIVVESPTKTKLTLKSTNPLVLYLTPAETIEIGPGKQTIEAKNWVSGEGATYQIPAGVTVRAVQYRETGFDCDFAGSFSCDDADFTTLWNKAARTAYICMRDHFYDCPDRERVGFWGDGTPELNQCFYVFDPRAHTLARDLVTRKLEPRFYPGQHLEFLGEYGLWFYYMHTGDIDAMRRIYIPTRNFLFETYQFGKRTWFDWGKENKDIAVIETCFYYDCLATLRKIAALTGHDADIPQIDAKRAAIKATFDVKYWKGNAYQSQQVKIPDDRANAMAVNCGLASEDKWDAIFTNVLLKQTFSSCFFDRWVFEAMCKMGKERDALLRMATRYRTMIPCSFTTLWEHYDRWWASNIDAFDDASSLNHGWNPPAIILSETICGVRPTQPGWTQFEVMPKDAFLNDLKVTVPTIIGNIHAAIKKTKSRYTLSVVIPAGTTATVGMPRNAFTQLDDVRVGRMLVWSQKAGSTPRATCKVTDANGYIQVALPAGSWQVTGSGRLPLVREKPIPAPAPRDKDIDKHGWKASASVPDSSFLFSGDKIPIAVPAANAIDADAWTGWRDMTSKQYPGQWFQVDMGKTERFSGIRLDNTWAQWDSPVGYEVRVSADGNAWSEPIASGKGAPGITRITFAPQRARFVRITQTGSSNLYHWSIYELDIFH
jgi:hypothetical protein